MTDPPLHELILEPDFRRAVDLLDAGDVVSLAAHLAAHPEVLSQRAGIPGQPVGSYFERPYLLWFVAENPIRHRRLPANIVEVTRTIIAAARAAGVDHLQRQLDYTLALVVSGLVPRETGHQRPLVRALVAEGADPNCLDPALIHGELDAVAALLDAGARLSLNAAAGLGRVSELRALLAGRPTAVELQQALAVAAVLGQPESAALLCEAGASPNRYNPPGFHAHSTPLHQAVLSGSAATVAVLLSHGADASIQDTVFGATACGWADHSEQPEIAAQLRA